MGKKACWWLGVVAAGAAAGLDAAGFPAMSKLALALASALCGSALALTLSDRRP